MSYTNDQTIESYSKATNLYAANLRNDVSDEVKEWLTRSLDGLRKDALIFEIGTATGRDADYVESQGFAVERSDAAKGFVDELNSTGKTARLFNVLTNEFNGKYDLILANAVFLHFNNQEILNALVKVFDALVDGGRFGLSLKCGNGEVSTTSKLNGPRYFKFWQPDEIRKALELVGFVNFSCKTSDDWRPDKPGWMFIVVEKGLRK